MKKYWIHVWWLASVPAYLWSGTVPDGYAIATLGKPHSYPTAGIIQAIVITLLEASIVYAVLQPPKFHRSWRRAAAAFAVGVPWLVLSLVFTLHAPPYAYVHALWALIMEASLAVVLAWAVVHELRLGKS